MGDIRTKATIFTTIMSTPLRLQWGFIHFGFWENSTVPLRTFVFELTFNTPKSLAMVKVIIRGQLYVSFYARHCTMCPYGPRYLSMTTTYEYYNHILECGNNGSKPVLLAIIEPASLRTCHNEVDTQTSVPGQKLRVKDILAFLLVIFRMVLTHFPRDKMDAVSQMVLSNVFSWMKSFVFWF